MRVTLHLDTFSGLDLGAYAIVWIDKEAGKWSREGHAGVELPQWGRCRTAQGATCLVAHDAGSDICTLEGLDLAAGAGPFEGEHGRVQWQACTQGPVAGQWHVQYVDESACTPEEALFADEDEAADEKIRIA
jgi:hypothetical protein